MREYAIQEHVADVSVVLASPFEEDGAVDLEGLTALVTHVVRGGARTLVVGGNTGEYYSLTQSEYLAQFETVRAAAGEAALFAGVAGVAEAASATGQTLLDGGADGLMVHHPFNPYATPRGIGRYFAQVAAGVDGPVIVYPRGPHFTGDALEELRCAENVVGVKYGHTDVWQFARLVRARPDLVWSCGLAESWAPVFWPFGARGFTSGLGNVSPERALELLEALRSSDEEAIRRSWDDVAAFEALRAKHSDGNNVAVIKAALDEVGLPGGPLRPPLTALDDEDRAELREILKQWSLTPLPAPS
jgi:4-hydroxy-tetrahydrodipicolinate synthase